MPKDEQLQAFQFEQLRSILDGTFDLGEHAERVSSIFTDEALARSPSNRHLEKLGRKLYACAGLVSDTPEQLDLF